VAAFFLLVGALVGLCSTAGAGSCVLWSEAPSAARRVRP
jgi:hypothetical protein